MSPCKVIRSATSKIEDQLQFSRLAAGRGYYHAFGLPTSVMLIQYTLLSKQRNSNENVTFSFWGVFH